MKKILTVILTLLLCVVLFSCGEKEPTYESIREDYTNQMEKETTTLVKEAKEEISDGADPYEVYAEKKEVLAKLNTKGGSEIGALYNDDTSEERVDKYKENTAKLTDAYLHCCDDIADACNIEI